MCQFTVVIIGGDQLFREGLEHLLRPTLFTVIGSAKSLLQIVPGPERLDLVVCGFDIETDVEEQFRSFSCARIGSPPPRVVVLTYLPDSELLSRASAANIGAVLSKDISTEVLLRSLELVMLGQQVFPALSTRGTGPTGPRAMPASQAGEMDAYQACRSEAAPRSGPEFSWMQRPGGHRVLPLSDREEQILQLLVAGAANKSIARDLCITEGTVKVHVKSLLRKLGASNRTQAAIWGMGRTFPVSGPIRTADPSMPPANGPELRPAVGCQGEVG